MKSSSRGMEVRIQFSTDDLGDLRVVEINYSNLVIAGSCRNSPETSLDGDCLVGRALIRV